MKNYDKFGQSSYEDDVSFVRKHAPGFIGKEEVVEESTDDELNFLIDHQNKITEYENRITSLRKEYDNVLEGIKKRL